MLPVHPRTCGEHDFGACPRLANSGSSPHVRGTFYQYLIELPLRRFIPARAGNMPVNYGDILKQPVHPRTCGEHLFKRPTGFGTGGSSPHVRGTYRHLRQDARQCTVHPRTCGEHAEEVDLGPSTPVHPRTCGEHSVPKAKVMIPCGSSPHVRGTWSEKPSRLGRGSSPHVRGTYSAQSSHLHDGSSPHVRGTSSQPYHTIHDPVHPRTCGEHSSAGSTSTIPVRFIPARAGNICFAFSSTLNAAGSSPHVRGTCIDTDKHPLHRRFIPARAGNMI